MPLTKSGRLICRMLQNLHYRKLCGGPSDLSDAEYEKFADRTLTKLADYFDTLQDLVKCDANYDISYSMGVLTAHVGPAGTYVINKQTPNKQIWFSSPISGPKRYDFSGGKWIYQRDGMTLHETLEKELQKIYQSDKINLPK